MGSVSAVNTLLGSTSSTASSAVNISSVLAATVGATTPGIDVTAAVAAAIAADRAPETSWNAQIATYTSQTSALTAIQTATAALTTDMSAMNTLTGPLSARTVTSSDTSAVTATAATGTVAGNHSIVVNTLATSSSYYSDAAMNATVALPPSSFVVTSAALPTKPMTITIGSAGVNSLNDVEAAVNANTALGVTASIVTDTTGSRLVLIANASGAAAGFSLTTPTTATSWTSPSLAAGQTLGVNTITLSSGTGASQSVTTQTGDTYTTLAASINALGLDLKATVVSDTDGTHLSIASNDTTSFTINQPALGEFGYTQASAGANAGLTVDGVPLSSATNTVTGAIPGVTLTLLSPTSAAGTNLTVASDSTQASTAINQFVTDYNTAIGLVNAQYTFSSNSGSEGVLSADPTVRTLQNSLMQALNYVSTPAAGTTSTVSTLNDLGITTSTDGSLNLNTTVLNNALLNNPTDVQHFFEGASLNGFANAMTNTFSNLTNASNGAFTVDLKSISASSASVAAEISDLETNYIANQQTILTAMYSSAEIALQSLPTEMAQIQAELGNTSKSGG